MLLIFSAALLFSTAVFAVRGGKITQRPITYTSAINESKAEGDPKYSITGASYEYTGFGSAESSIEIEDDGTLIFSPAFANKQVGFVTSNDNGKTWSMVIPSQNQSRTQPMFNIHDGRYFFWSSSMPGLRYSYSDDKGKTWNLVSKNLNTAIMDWAKIVDGKPVRSQLKEGSKILYMSAPSILSVSVVPGLGPVNQRIWKSLDRGITWQQTKQSPTLSALDSGGPCEAFTRNKSNSEYIIWSNGLVRPNGTIMFGVRRCRTASIAISDDEGDTWRWSDVPGSSLTPYTLALGTYVVVTTLVAT
jgi:BNR/Asp-box repeat